VTEAFTPAQLRRIRQIAAFLMVLSGLAAIAIILILAIAHAHDLDEPYGEWFSGLRQPDNPAVPCCGGPHSPTHDCYATLYRQVAPEDTNDSGYRALIDRKWGPGVEPAWVKVPASKLLQRTPNPTGEAVACWLSGPGILCFVRPTEG
jgi:hypothetical protein